MRPGRSADTVLVVGEALVDRVHGREDDPVEEVLGGAPFNVARGLGRLGVPCMFLGAVGADPAGDSLVAALVECGVDASSVQRDARPTASVEVTLGPEGPRYRFAEDDTADRHWSGPAEPAALPGAVALHVGSNALAREPVGSAVERFVAAWPAGLTVTIDPNVRPEVIADDVAYRRRLNALIARSAVVKVSTDDLAYLAPGEDAPSFARRVLDGGSDLVVVTVAEKGAFGASAVASVHVASMARHVVDTVGAGDSAMAGLLWALQRRGGLTHEALRGLGAEELDDVLEVAMACAARTLAHRGAYAPTPSELNLTTS